MTVAIIFKKAVVAAGQTLDSEPRLEYFKPRWWQDKNHSAPRHGDAERVEVFGLSAADKASVIEVLRVESVIVPRTPYGGNWFPDLMVHPLMMMASPL